MDDKNKDTIPEGRTIIINGAGVSTHIVKNSAGIITVLKGW